MTEYFDNARIPSVPYKHTTQRVEWAVDTAPIDATDVTDSAIPDTRTCWQKMTDRIAALAARVALLEIAPTVELQGMLEIADEINDLRARVAKLEALNTAVTRTVTTDTAIDDRATITWYGDPPAAVAVAGTPGTSYDPGGWVDQLAAAVDD